jgi:hypothetical protein
MGPSVTALAEAIVWVTICDAACVCTPAELEVVEAPEVEVGPDAELAKVRGGVLNMSPSVRGLAEDGGHVVDVVAEGLGGREGVSVSECTRD